MKNKKMLGCLIALLALSACGNNTNEEAKEDTVRVSIYKDAYLNLLGEDNLNTLKELGLDEIEDGEVTLFGTDLSTYTFTDYDGNTVNLSGGPYILEVLSSGCKYCQKLTRESLQPALDNDIQVYQYFISSSNDDIDNFYSEDGINKLDGVVMLRDCSSLEGMLRKKELNSVPLTMIVDENGKISITHIGYIETDTYLSLYNYGLSNKLYALDIDGLDLYSYLKRQTKIKDYIYSLEEIDIPKSVLDD